jgi:ankyrin repeat protein
MSEELITAARCGYADTIQELLEEDNYLDYDLSTPLYWSATEGHIDAVCVLLAASADPTAHYHGALMSSAANGHAHIVRELIEAGADVDARDNTAVITSAKRGHIEVVRVLLEYGATADNNALIFASQYSHAKIIRLLLDYGADPTAANNQVVKNAAKNCRCDIIKVLADHMRYSNTCRYYYHGAILYILYNVPPEGELLLPGTNIWCSNPHNASAEYIENVINKHSRKSARS